MSLAIINLNATNSQQGLVLLGVVNYTDWGSIKKQVYHKNRFS